MIKDILVQLTGSGEDEFRLAYAEAVATLFDAHVTGLYLHQMPQLMEFADPMASVVLTDILAEAQQRGDATATRLRARLDRLPGPTELRRRDVYSATTGNVLAREAATADLFVGTRPYGDPTHMQGIEEAVLFGAGRACLFAPPGAMPSATFGRVLIGWNGSRESARAVAEAMPFLHMATEITIVVVEDGASAEIGEAPGADIARHLSRHGLGAELRVLSGRTDAGDALLAEARARTADLIVIGGYGHSRFREWALGGVTRHLLHHATVPVLVAH
jgi:nucleotide-binding universal stress UspA family protein